MGLLDGSLTLCVDDLLSMFFNSQFEFASAMVPIFGPVGKALLNTTDDKWFNDKVSLSPVIGLVNKGVRTPRDVWNAAVEGASKGRAVRNTLDLIAISTRVPIGFLGRPIGFLLDVQEGRAEPEGILDYTRGLITGKPGNR